MESSDGRAIHAGFSYVVPYVYDFTVYAKHRWAGLTLAEALSREYLGYPPAYIRWAIEQGLVLIEGECGAAGRILRQGQRVRQIVHRHEIPVPAVTLDALNIVDHGSLVSMCKPAGWPCHPGGAYRRNSLSELLREVSGLERISLLYRLDRVVSGVLLFVKSQGGEEGGESGTSASSYMRALAHPSSIKIYVARVAGRCGGAATLAEPPLSAAPLEAAARRCLAGAQSVRYPIVCLDSRRGVYDAGTHLTTPVMSTESTIVPRLAACESEKAVMHVSAKPAETTIVPILYDSESDTTVVLVRPVTGRTHQLRVHLRAAGHPIANDPSYGPPAHIAERYMPSADAVPLSWRFEADWIAAGAVSTAADASLLPPSCSLAELVQHCPFCARVRASTAAELAPREKVSEGLRITAEDADAPSDLVSEEALIDGDDGLALISARPRPFQIWLHSLAYRVSARTGVPPPYEFQAEVPVWVPTAAVDLLRATLRAWLDVPDV